MMTFDDNDKKLIFHLQQLHESRYLVKQLRAVAIHFQGFFQCVHHCRSQAFGAFVGFANPGFEDWKVVAYRIAH